MVSIGQEVRQPLAYKPHLTATTTEKKKKVSNRRRASSTCSAGRQRERRDGGQATRDYWGTDLCRFTTVTTCYHGGLGRTAGGGGGGGAFSGVLCNNILMQKGGRSAFYKAGTASVAGVEAEGSQSDGGARRAQRQEVQGDVSGARREKWEEKVKRGTAKDDVCI